MRVIALLFLFALESILHINAMTSNRMIISSPLDLQGKEMNLSNGTSLIFKDGGCILNGVVKGEHITVKAGRKLIFSNVKLDGTFTAKEAHSVWFGAKSDCLLGQDGKFVSGTDNAQAFQNLFLFDNVVIAPGTYLVKQQIKCKSNQKIDGCNAKLKFLYKGSCFLIDGNSNEPIRNLKLRRLNIIGSKNDYSDITEHWMGIQIGFVDNIEIKDVICEYCRGDGFYIGTSIRSINNRIPQNITLRNVKAYFNHRQGLSITRVKDAKIISSEFCYTSGTNPQAGIDVEPNMKELDDGTLSVGVCEDVLIEDCFFKGNKKEGLKMSDYYHYSSADKHINDIIVRNCTFVDDNLAIYGVSDCKFLNLSFDNSVIEVKGRNAISNIYLSDIKMKADKGNKFTYAIRLGYHESQPLRDNITLNNIKIKGYNGAAIRVDSEWPMKNGKLEKVRINNCISEDCGSEIVYGRQEFFLSLKEKTVKKGIVWLFLLPIGGIGFFIVKKRKHKV